MIDQLIRTALTELVGVRHPVVQTGMGWVSGPRLVSGTANAGGLGILASATMSGSTPNRRNGRTTRVTVSSISSTDVVTVRTVASRIRPTSAPTTVTACAHPCCQTWYAVIRVMTTSRPRSVRSSRPSRARATASSTITNASSPIEVAGERKTTVTTLIAAIASSLEPADIRWRKVVPGW